METLLPTIIANMIVWLPILLSVVALVISGLSLYFTHLRSSNIILDKTNLSNRTDIRMSGGRNGIWADNFTLFYKLYLENLGNRTGSFEGINIISTPRDFKNFTLYFDTQLRSAEATDGQYTVLPERLTVKEGEIIPVMMAIKFKSTFKGDKANGEDEFRKLWEELINLKRTGKPIITVSYVVKEFKGIFGNKNQSKPKIIIKNLAEDVVGAHVGILKEIAVVSQQRDYKVAQWALGILNK